MTVAAIPPTENRKVGILWMLATMLCFIILDSLMKLGLETMTLVEVTWGRFFFATLFAAALCGRNLARLAISDSPKIQLIRSIFLMITTGLFNAGLMTVSLPTATTIMYLSPVFVTILSIFVLSEHVGLRRWTSIAVAFAGAVIVVAPWQDGGNTAGAGELFLVAAAFSNAAYQITTRQLRHDDPMTSLLYTACAGAVVSSLLLPMHWSGPGPTGWLLLIGSGLIGLVGHLCIIRAFRAAPASVIAPFSYSSLIWATLFGFVIWNDWPTANTWVGAALIVASGLYIFFRERKLRASS